MPDKPAKRFRIGAVQAAIWKNDGPNHSFYTVTMQRSYKDGDDWKNTDSLGSGDLLNAAHVLMRAEAWISEQL